MECDRGNFLAGGSSFSAACVGPSFRISDGHGHDGNWKESKVSYSQSYPPPICHAVPGGCRLLVKENLKVQYQTREGTHKTGSRWWATRETEVFAVEGTFATAICKPGTVSTGATKADGIEKMICRAGKDSSRSRSLGGLGLASGGGVALDVQRQSSVLSGFVYQWSPAPPEGGFVCSIAVCPNLMMPEGMVAKTTMGEYGLRTENSLVSLVCPAADFSARPSNHKFICEGGKWKPSTQLSFNGRTFDPSHVFPGQYVVDIDPVTGYGIWWDPEGTNDPGGTPLGWRGQYFCGGVSCDDKYRLPNSVHPNNPDDTSATHEPLYGYEATAEIARKMYKAPQGTTYMYVCSRGYYREYKGVQLVCLDNSLWYAYDEAVLEKRRVDEPTSDRPKSLGELIDSKVLTSGQRDVYAEEELTSHSALVVRQQGTPQYNQVTRCLLSKCPDSQLDYRNLEPYQNTFSTRIIYGFEGIEPVPRVLGGSMSYECFSGYIFFDTRAKICRRICTQAAGVLDVPVLSWALHPLSPPKCDSIAIACIAQYCPPIVGFPGNVQYVDTWDPARLRYFGSDLVFDPTQAASHEANRANAMYDLYDKNWDYSQKHPEVSSCLGRFLGDNPTEQSDPDFFLRVTSLGRSRCSKEEPADTTATQDMYVCAGTDLPDRMPSSSSGFGHRSALYEALAAENLSPSLMTKLAKGIHTKANIAAAETSIMTGWKSQFGHNGNEMDSRSDTGVPVWAYWERCMAMAQIVNQVASGRFVLPSAQSLPTMVLPRAGAGLPADIFAAEHDGGAATSPDPVSSACPPDYLPDDGFGDDSDVGTQFLKADQMNAAFVFKNDAPEYLDAKKILLRKSAKEDCANLCSSKKTWPYCKAYAWVVNRCWFWQISWPTVFPARRQADLGHRFVQWCARKETLFMIPRNGLRYDYRGCFTLDINNVMPHQYRLPKNKGHFHRIFQDRMYGVDSCADRCMGGVVHEPAPDQKTVPGHYSSYHARYVGIAGRPKDTNLWFPGVTLVDEFIEENIEYTGNDMSYFSSNAYSGTEMAKFCAFSCSLVPKCLSWASKSPNCWLKHGYKANRKAMSGVFAGLPTRCIDPVAWIRANILGPHTQNTGNGFYMDRGDCQAGKARMIPIPRGSVSRIYAAYLGVNDEWTTAEQTTSSMFLPLAVLSPQRAVRPWLPEFFGLGSDGAKCLCIGSFPPLYDSEDSDKNKQKFPNGMEPITQRSCPAVCSDGLTSCGNQPGASVSTYSMYALDARAEPHESSSMFRSWHGTTTVADVVRSTSGEDPAHKLSHMFDHSLVSYWKGDIAPASGERAEITIQFTRTVKVLQVSLSCYAEGATIAAGAFCAPSIYSSVRIHTSDDGPTLKGRQFGSELSGVPGQINLVWSESGRVGVITQIVIVVFGVNEVGVIGELKIGYLDLEAVVVRSSSESGKVFGFDPSQWAQVFSTGSPPSAGDERWVIQVRDGVETWSGRVKVEGAGDVGRRKTGESAAQWKEGDLVYPGQEGMEQRSSCESVIFRKNGEVFLAGARWEAKLNWDCFGPSLSGTATKWVVVETNTVPGCADLCLRTPDCVAFGFTFSNGGVDSCDLKSSVQNSIELAKSCGAAQSGTAFYTLLERTYDCPSAQASFGLNAEVPALSFGPVFSTSIMQQTWGRSCDTQDLGQHWNPFTRGQGQNDFFPDKISAEISRISKAPACERDVSAWEGDNRKLPDGQCHANVCGDGVCCRSKQFGPNCPVFDNSPANVFQAADSMEAPTPPYYGPDYSDNPAIKWTCQPRSGTAPRDPYDAYQEAEPLRFVRFWQIQKNYCDHEGYGVVGGSAALNTAGVGRCVIPNVAPLSRSCNMMYESDVAHFKVPVESKIVLKKFKSETEVEGMTIEELKQINTVMGANRVVIRPKFLQSAQDYPQENIPESLSFCRIYKENRIESPRGIRIRDNVIGSQRDRQKFMSFWRSDFLHWYGDTAECASYGGSTSHDFLTEFDAIEDIRSCALVCGDSGHQHGIDCGHWQYDVSTKKCQLKSVVFQDIVQLTDTVSKGKLYGPPCRSVGGVGAASAATGGRAKLSIESIPGNTLGGETWENVLWGRTRMSVYHYRRGKQDLVAQHVPLQIYHDLVVNEPSSVFFAHVAFGICDAADTTHIVSLGQVSTPEECAFKTLGEATCGVGFTVEAGTGVCLCGKAGTNSAECLETHDGDHSAAGKIYSTAPSSLNYYPPSRGGCDPASSEPTLLPSGGETSVSKCLELCNAHPNCRAVKYAPSICQGYAICATPLVEDSSKRHEITLRQLRIYAERHTMDPRVGSNYFAQGDILTWEPLGSTGRHILVRAMDNYQQLVSDDYRAGIVCCTSGPIDSGDTLKEAGSHHWLSRRRSTGLASGWSSPEPNAGKNVDICIGSDTPVGSQWSHVVRASKDVWGGCKNDMTWGEAYSFCVFSQRARLCTADELLTGNRCADGSRTSCPETTFYWSADGVRVRKLPPGRSLLRSAIQKRSTHTV